nr:uncharacterized protein KIAA1958-like [Pelodiscus sinensis]XP_025039816.1 uncharacterized protein KIAA1958-like [Pelodiscus sinensis]XP_025039817.1 uncharacterized protein KIAA1958-like [Pelodiscus sinensis]|eukprot:XP_025039815.1 uncharacterized protein KIAA1958-like [Pelodiscus sinensis]
MSENVCDDVYNNVSSVAMDLSNLVTWAHTHGTICSQIPGLEIIQNMGHPTRDNSVLWICESGHAYHWPCGALYFRSQEEREEAVEQRKRSRSYDSWSMEHNVSEKRYRVVSPFEQKKADSINMGSSSRSPEVMQRKEDAFCVMSDTTVPKAKQSEALPQKDNFSTRPCFAAELSLPSNECHVKTDPDNDEPESREDRQEISDEEEFEAGDPIYRSNCDSERVVQNKETSAEEELQIHGDGKVSSKEATIQTTVSVFKEKAAVIPCLQGETLEDSAYRILEHNCLKLTALHPTKAKSKTSKARDSYESTVSKEKLKPFPVSSVETKAQFEPSTFMVFYDTAPTGAVHQQLQLCPSTCATSGTGVAGNYAEIPPEKSKQPGPLNAANSSALPTLENENSEDNLPVSSNKKTLKKSESKRIRNIGDIKMFRDWLASHYPSETREIFTLPPADLDNYLASFYTRVRKQNGTEFSANSLFFFQSSIDRYLKEHKYEYSVSKGPEFTASQEALKAKCQHLARKERERDWNILENLTDRDVENLRKKGILSRMHPEGFLHLMLVNIIRGFGANTHSQTPNLWWGQIVLKKNVQGLEYLEWKDDLNTQASTEESVLYIYAKPDNPGNCPVRDYKEYAKRRPLDMHHDRDPFYLSPKPLCCIWDQIWYCRKALTKTKMEKMMKVIVQQVKGSEKRSMK